MVQFDAQRRLAIAELLSRPDPPDLQRRSHHLRIEGKPDRYALVATLVAAFVQKRLLAAQERRALRTERHNIRWAPQGVRQKEEVLTAA